LPKDQNLKEGRGEKCTITVDPFGISKIYGIDWAKSIDALCYFTRESKIDLRFYRIIEL
jgi:hypothetical protein